MRALAPVTLALLVVPLVWSIGDDVRLTRTDTRVVAHALDRVARAARARRSPPSPRRRRSSGHPCSGSRCRARAAVRPQPGRRPAAGARASATSSSPARSPTACSPRATATRARPRFYDQLRTRTKRRLPCAGRARPHRALGRRLPAVRRRHLLSLIPLVALRARRLPATPTRDSSDGRRATAPTCPAAWRRLAEAREPDPRAGLLPRLDAHPARPRDRRPLEQHRLGQQGPQLPHRASSGRRRGRGDRT